MQTTQSPSANYIDAGIGYIRWSSDNLQLIALMERLQEKLKTTPPNEILK